MELDTRGYYNQPAFNVESPQERQAKQIQLQNAQMQQSEYERKMRQSQQDDDDEIAYKDIFRNAVEVGEDGQQRVNPQKALAGMWLKFPDKADEFQKQLETQQQTAQTAKWDRLTKGKEVMQKVLVGATAQDYKPRRQMLIDNGIAEANDLPLEFDPNAINSLMTTVESYRKGLEPKAIKIGFAPNGQPYNENDPTAINMGANYAKTDSGSDNEPALVKEYKFAQKDGFKGSFQDFRTKTTESPQENAMDYGLPKPQSPWATVTDPKARDRFKQKEYELARKKIDALDAVVTKNNNASARADRFLQLNRNNGTGGFADKVPGGQWTRSFGDEYAEMQSISSDLIPEMREPGSGSTSDFDAGMFQKATIGVDKPGNTNKNIVKAMQEKAKVTTDKRDFLNAYLEQNGTLTGADASWTKYAEANPIFDKTKTDFSLNTKRKSWNDYFTEIKIGGVEEGHIYLGGDKANPKSWKKAK